MKQCDCYHTTTYITFIKHECWGTRERDECSCGGDRTRCDFYPEVRKKALQEIEPEFGEWISVEDRLPKKKGKYLCCQKGYMQVYSFALNLEKIDKYDFMGENHQGWYNYNGEYGYYEIDDVTYWMPLPEPPKGE